MNLENLIKKINKMEFHQSLLLNMISHSKMDLYKLIIHVGLNQEEFYQFCQNCEYFNNKLEEQKAEGFVSFDPLFEEFKNRLPSKLRYKEVIEACINQEFYPMLMLEFRKYL